MRAVAVYVCAARGTIRLDPAALTVWWTPDGPVVEVQCPCGDWHYPSPCRACALALIVSGAAERHEIPEMADRARGLQTPLTDAWVTAQEDHLRDPDGGWWPGELAWLRDATRTLP